MKDQQYIQCQQKKAKFKVERVTEVTITYMKGEKGKQKNSDGKRI
jgi:hypothetical protein